MKDRLDILCDGLIRALLEIDDSSIISTLQSHLDFIYFMFPEQKVIYEGQLEDIDSNRGIDEAKNQDCQ